MAPTFETAALNVTEVFSQEFTFTFNGEIVIRGWIAEPMFIICEELEQPLWFVIITPYVPGELTEIEDVVWLKGYHRIFVVALEFNWTLLPGHRIVSPTIETVGITGRLFTITEIVLELIAQLPRLEET